ncbi:hypothetical protein QAD02_000946 [Eretmocerus hayati]|uniref:Uncharacterized protein n=1 Tax=Eretmocerus hayati TaxID=131215 RepID=A0ACC2NHG2_9HYME|nr:hypothetical protein QAD02_000946 [Eretmocerus hayati]
MTNAIQEVLSDLGWSDGFRIPIANAENKRLEQEIEAKSRKRAGLKAQLEANSERVKEMRLHGSDVRQQQRENQRLLAASSAQLEAERQIYRQAQIDESRLLRELHDREKNSDETQRKLTSLQNELDKLAKKLDSTSAKIQLDQQRLAAWEEQLAKADDRNLVIEQFVRSDEKTFKKIEQERQMLSEKAEVYRQAVTRIVGDIHEMEMMLDRTAHLYSQGMRDRRHLMDQWSQSVQVLTQRDKSIYDTIQEIDSMRQVVKERMEAYEEAERYFNIQINENKELEHEIRQLEKKLNRGRDERQKLRQINESFAIQLHCQQKQLQELARNIEDMRANLKRKRNQVQNKRIKLSDCKRSIVELKESLKNIEGQKMNVAEKTKQLQDMLEKEERAKSTLAKETERAQSLCQRATSRLNELKGERAVLGMRQKAEARRKEQLASELAGQEARQQEMRERVYNSDVALQRAEMRMQLLQGQAQDEQELDVKNKKLVEVTAIYKQRSETLKTLQSQLGSLENEIRKTTASIASNDEELSRQRSKQRELLLLIDGAEKQLRLASQNYTERTVEKNIIQLRLSEALKIAAKVGDRLYDLEKYALQMEAAMQERRADINAQKESLGVQRRCAQAENAELRSMVSERRIRIQQLQARYELLIASLGANPEDGSPITATYLAIQSAQERYLLQERGDQLDRSIRKAEHEVRSMENTLRLVNACNDKYKGSLSLVDDGGPEKAEQRRLDQELLKVLEIAREKKNQLEQAQYDCERMEENCEQLDKDIERIKQEKENKRRTASELEQQINEQERKLSRADKNLRKVIKDVQNKCVCTSDETILLQERDIAVRELQELNQLALQRIAEFATRHLEADAYVKKLLSERGIELPSAFHLKLGPPSVTPLNSSRSTSVTSSRSTISSRPSVSRDRGFSTTGSYVGPVRLHSRATARSFCP